MTTIDMNSIREALPKHAQVFLKVKKTPNGNVIYLECFCYAPELSESGFEMCKQWQREIIGQDAISEFYTEETGCHWLVFLKRVPLEFINITDVDAETYVNAILNHSTDALY